ncbi:MAG TPA: hypothetical protein VG457_16825 [Planctomycetota bacterium]|nr:hypothetical protein [Planctomycetota bacterium]
MTKLNDYEYRVDAPANGSASMDSGLEATEAGAGSHRAGLLGLIPIISLFLFIIFWFLKKQP